MGYRSDVSLIFYPRLHDENAVPFAALKLWFDENYPHHEAKTEWDANIDAEDGYISVEYHDVKWYADFDHVKAVNEAIFKFRETFNADEEHATASHEFVRLGEEVNDIEEDRTHWSDYRMRVERRIEFE